MIAYKPQYIRPGETPGTRQPSFWERIFGYRPQYIAPPDDSPDEPCKSEDCRPDDPGDPESPDDGPQD